MIEFSLQKKINTAEGELQLDASAELEKGGFYALYGTSGAGKTTILRMLAGLENPESGFIKQKNECWFSSEGKINKTPQHRKIGFVFQDYALFPNMTVQENISFATTGKENTELVDELLGLTGLTNLKDRKTTKLSGGQQQRVALARAIARKPDLLLLDEPLSAVDNEMREQLQIILMQLHKRFCITTLLVSHSNIEIMRLAQQIFHLEKGSLQKAIAPVDFFLNEQTEIKAQVLDVKEYGAVIVLIGSQLFTSYPNSASLKVGDVINISSLKEII